MTNNTDQLERVAEIVYEAMKEAAMHIPGHNFVAPNWVYGGNAKMQDVARDNAEKAIATLQGFEPIISDFPQILLCAFRYSLGRRSYIVGSCVEWLTIHWGAMPDAWKRLIHDEIGQAIKLGHAGDKMDIDSWNKVLSLPLPPTEE